MQLRWKSRLRMVYGHLRDKESSPYRAELCLFWGDLWKKASITSSFILVWTAYSSWLLINYSVTTDLLQTGGGDYRNTTDLLLIYYKSEEDDYLSTTDLLLNYVITVLWTIRTSDPLLFMLDALANASRSRNKLRPRSPFSDEKNAGNRTYPGWMGWIFALCTCVHTHACHKNRACAFLAGFRVVCCLFCRFPVRNALRASEAVHATDVMVNGVADSSIKKCHNTIFMI